MIYCEFRMAVEKFDFLVEVGTRFSESLTYSSTARPQLVRIQLRYEVVGILFVLNADR
jgi:hypothetical protein